MTHNHTIWMQQDRDAAMAVLERLAPTPEARLEKAPMQREKDYLYALETLYGNTEASAGKSKEERDDLYRDEMARLHAAYPDDHEAAAFYGLSILGTAHEGRDFAIYMRAAAVLEQIWDANRKHPGAAHYLIHSYDDPIHAPLGLPMARVYAQIAPAASHAQHMTSHIFVALGMWDDVVEANIVARDVQNTRFVELGQPTRVCGHYPYWLEYGYLQQGRFDEAAEVLQTCFDRIESGSTASEDWHFDVMRARYVLDTGDWDAAARWTPSAGADRTVSYYFTTAYAALKRGDPETARRHLETMQALDAGDEEALHAVLTGEIEALLALHDGDADAAVRQVEVIVDREAALPYEFGPPQIVKPSAELLGDVLLELGRPDEAVQAFQAQLQQTPLRTAALLGLARAATAAGRAATAADAYARLAAVWHAAGPGVPGLDEVRDAAAASE